MKLAVILLVKIIIKISRLFGHNGSALPGLIAEKLYPNLLKDTLIGLKSGIIVVTGTNGKTTTTKIISELLSASDKKVLTNRSGSNFTRGILSTVIEKSTLTGELPYDIGVFELDEAYARLFTKEVKPRILVALNVLRDQLDRYGEITKTADLIGEAAKSADYVVLNADDPPISNLSKKLSFSRTKFFGMSSDLKLHLPSDDELHGSVATKNSNQKVDLKLIAAEDLGSNQKITLQAGKEKFLTNFNLKGIYNAVNAAAAILTVKTAFPETSYSNVACKLSQIQPAFGRGEVIDVEGRKIVLGLIKNPAGFNQNIRSFIDSDVDAILIVINDKYADGRDVSWLWDVNVDKLAKVSHIHTSGIRTYDMALRLKYSDIDINPDFIDQDINRSLKKIINLTKPGDKIVIFPTYTAMLKIRKIFSKNVKVDSIW
ncbi:Mur ligase family protein [Candidatus Saccharibacteria bacterium CPR2]|nr:Mur ligase family protein [Candidatus Saccharibacteria bacterium CPR2]